MIDEKWSKNSRVINRHNVTTKIKMLFRSESNSMEVLNSRIPDALLEEFKELTTYKYDVDPSTLVRVMMYIATKPQMAPLINHVIYHLSDKNDEQAELDFETAILKCLESSKLYDEHIRRTDEWWQEQKEKSRYQF